jgi:prepilin-type N-terminal cleavage/methylation domain-containing protein
MRRRAGEPFAVPDRAGFTLLELLIVLILLSLAGGLVAVRVGSGTDRARFESAVGQCAAFVRAAKDHARTHSVPVEILVDPEERRLVAVALETESGGPVRRRTVAVFPLPAVVEDFRIEPTDPLYSGDGRARLAFTFLGTTPGGTILLLRSGQQGKSIRVLQPMGALEVSIYESG